MELTREHFRAMIFYDYKSGLDHNQCYQRLSAAVSDCAPSLSTITGWYREFQRGRESLQDEPRPGRPSTACSDENVQLIRDIVNADRRVTYDVIEASVGISSGTVRKILHEELGLKKVTSRWIPHLLTQEEKNARVEWCRFMLQKFDGGKSRSVSQIVTGDETWIYTYEPEKKSQSQVWMFPDEERPTKVVRNRSVGKRMVATFLRRSGHLSTVTLGNRQTVNAEWYTTVCLPQVFSVLKQQRPKTALRGIFLHHDNASAHTAARTLDFLGKEGVQLLPHPAYSPDLAPCDFFVFPRLKDLLRGRRFDTAELAIDAYETALKTLTENDWHNCFDIWFQRMNHCVNASGEYFEKL
jgi:histone-lysine N-methyltransferase SETMAR